MGFKQIWLIAMHITATWQLAYYATCHCHDSHVFEIVKKTHTTESLSVFEVRSDDSEQLLFIRSTFLGKFSNEEGWDWGISARTVQVECS